jgi:hypothetical protein
MRDLEKEVKMKPPGKVYKEAVAEQTNIQPSQQPRNLRQVQSMKAKTQDTDRLTRDAIANIHELAYSSPGFVKYIATYPDLVVVCGSEFMQAELKQVLSLNSVDQLFLYDTTFSLGEFYVSPLLFRHVAFEGSPVMMLGALIHERKFTSHHEIFFSQIMHGIKHKGLPIATDEEAAIISAIRLTTNFLRVGCHRHLRDDIGRWVDNHGGIKDDREVYVADVTELLLCEDFSGFTKLLQAKEARWSEPFIDYFRARILTKVEEYGTWSVSKLVTTGRLITTNQSEGFNTLLKSLQDWKEVPPDVVMLSLQMLQKYYQNEICRGKCGIGNLTLKSCFAHMAHKVE